MFQTTSAIYGVKYQSRCVEAQLAQQEKHSFLVGTLNPREENEIHSIEFDENDNEIICHAIYRHPHEVWTLSTSPAHEDIFSTCYHDGEDFKTSLWRMCDEKQASDSEEAQDLTKLFDLDGHDGLTKMLFHTVEGCGDRIMTLDSGTLRSFSIGKQGTGPINEPLFKRSFSGLMAGCWDPHHLNNFIAVGGRDIRAFDLRAQEPLTTTITGAHDGVVRDIDFNPNKPYHIVTGGEDRKIRIWDLRKPSLPLSVMASHSHWVWSVKFNRFHDQLLISAGSSSSVNLWSIVSVSSAPLGDLEDPQNEKEGDLLVKTFEEHEDSVYSVAWSCYDAWIFASLSYDGRLVINHVPPAEKYKILL